MYSMYGEHYFSEPQQRRWSIPMTSLLRALGAVATTSPSSLIDTSRIVLTADNRVLDTNVLHTTTSNEYYRVFLKRVLLAWDVRGDFLTI